MDWTGLNQINTILGIINGVVGIINIGTAFWGWLNHKNKKQFMEKLEKERISAQKENARVCRTCKSNFKARITSLEPVSYTHLDVYKRQILQLMMISTRI